jgi:hypothetical protein
MLYKITRLELLSHGGSDTTLLLALYQSRHIYHIVSWTNNPVR